MKGGIVAWLLLLLTLKFQFLFPKSLGSAPTPPYHPPPIDASQPVTVDGGTLIDPQG